MVGQSPCVPGRSFAEFLPRSMKGSSVSLSINCNFTAAVLHRAVSRVSSIWQQIQLLASPLFYFRPVPVWYHPSFLASLWLPLLLHFFRLYSFLPFLVLPYYYSFGTSYFFRVRLCYRFSCRPRHTLFSERTPFLCGEKVRSWPPNRTR